MTCHYCRQPLVGMAARARYCSRKCALYARRARKRAEAQIRRPRCIICSAPLPYGKVGFNFRARTCSRVCAVNCWNWFGRVQKRPTSHATRPSA